jgi:hypothetical protein
MADVIALPGAELTAHLAPPSIVILHGPDGFHLIARGSAEHDQHHDVIADAGDAIAFALTYARMKGWSFFMSADAVLALSDEPIA